MHHWRRDWKMPCRSALPQSVLLLVGLCCSAGAWPAPTTQSESVQSLVAPSGLPSASVGGSAEQALRMPSADSRTPVRDVEDAHWHARESDGAVTLERAGDESAGVDGPRATLKQSTSVVPMEENPRVDVFDVVKSVAVDATQSVPWLRTKAPRRRDSSGDRDAAADRFGGAGREKIQYSNFASNGPGIGNPADDTGAMSTSTGRRINLVQEAVQIVRDVAGNPLSWLLTLLLVIGSLAFSVTRGQGGK